MFLGLNQTMEQIKGRGEWWVPTLRLDQTNGQTTTINTEKYLSLFAAQKQMVYAAFAKLNSRV